MFVFDHVSKSYHIQAAHKRVFSDLNHLARDMLPMPPRRQDHGMGDKRLRIRCEEALLDSRNRRYCRSGAVVYGGTLVSYNRMEEASDVHHRLQLLAA